MLVPESAEYVEHHRQHHTQQDRRSQRKVESSVLAAVDDVAGESAERQMSPTQQHERNSGDEDNRTKENQ